MNMKIGQEGCPWIWVDPFEHAANTGEEWDELDAANEIAVVAYANEQIRTKVLQLN